MEGLREVLSAVQKGEHAQLLLTPDGKPLDFEGQNFTTKNVYALPQKREDMPNALELYSLSGLVQYLTSVRPNEEFEKLFVHVESPESVTVRGKLIGHMERRTYAKVVYCAPEVQGFRYNYYCPQEQMMIALLSLFQDSTELADVVKRIGNLAAETVKTSTDDGVTQQVIVKTGLRTETAAMPGLVHLRPFSTFAEVEQPSRRFLLRLQGAKEGQLPQCGLWEADNGSWENEARQNIRQYLRQELADNEVAGIEVIA